MTLKLEATYENGVFVPSQRPALPDHQRVQLTVESTSVEAAALDTVLHRRKQRIQLDPGLAMEIASAADFDPNE